MSPIYHVNAGDAPTLILHGDADELVPLQQSEIIVEKFKEAGVPAELIVKKGAGHGIWPSMLIQDFGTIADWFDQHLLDKPAPAAERRGGRRAGRRNSARADGQRITKTPDRSVRSGVCFC